MSWTDTPPLDLPGRITVVGNPGLDTLVVLAEDHPDLEADGHFVRNVDTVGHAAAFTARACARLGHDTRILGSTGADVIGGLVRGVLAADGVDTSLMFDDPAGTARSVNFVRPDGRRTFFYDGGSHMTLRPPEPSVEAALSGTDLVLASLPNWARDVVARALRARPARGRGPAGRPRPRRPLPCGLHRLGRPPLRLRRAPRRSGGGCRGLVRRGTCLARGVRHGGARCDGGAARRRRPGRDRTAPARPRPADRRHHRRRGQPRDRLPRRVAVRWAVRSPGRCTGGRRWRGSSPATWAGRPPSTGHGWTRWLGPDAPVRVHARPVAADPATLASRR